MSDERPLKAGVIGLGVGEQHLIGYARIPGVTVKAVCDIDPAKLSAVADRNAVDGRTTDWRRIIEDPEIDVVSICSHDDDHAEQAIAAFQHGKHVMCEKPVCLHRREAEALLRAKEDSGKLLTSNLILRHSPRFKALKERITAGEMGEIFYLEGDYIHQILWKITEGWRGLMDFYCVLYGGGIHLIDLMRWLIDDEVIEVSGMANKVLTPDSTFQYDDTTVNLLRFSRGALAKSLTTFGPQRTQLHALSVYGSKATFVNDLPEAKLFTGDRPEDESRDRTPYPAIDKFDLLPDFVAAIRSDREPIVGSRDVFRVMDICFACREAIETRRTVAVSYLL